MKALVLFSASLFILLSNTSFASSNHGQKLCSLQTLKADHALLKSLNFSNDPIGLAVEAKTKGTNVEQLFQHYAVQNHCKLYTISMMDLVNGLLKGSTSMLSQGDNAGSSSSDMQNMSKKYLVVEGDKALCVKKLGLKLPLKTFLPNASVGKGATS